MTRKRLLIADDHDLIIAGVSELLAPDFDIIGGVKNGRLLISEAKRLLPDIVILDIGMPELNGIEAARILTETLPAIAIIFLTQQLEGNYVHSAFDAGAKGYVAKQSASTELVDAVRFALSGRYFVSPLVVPKRPDLFLQRNTRANPVAMFRSRLTGRQREVLQLVAEGKSVKEIAVALDISIATVNFHKGAIMDELGMRTTAELTRYAIANGIIDR